MGYRRDIARDAERTMSGYRLDNDTVLMDKLITANGVYEAKDDHAKGYREVDVRVSNTYTQADEGKVVDDGKLVAQTAISITANGSYDTTSNNRANVNVPNTYTQGDENKVVHNGALIAQTSKAINANGTYDTTLNSQAVVNVPNTYTQEDENKVVRNGLLVAQTPLLVVENGVYDTTVHTPTTVNLPDYEIRQWGGSGPAAIEIVTPPTKLDYVEGELIDYSGIVVRLLDGNGNLFTDPDYPDGIVPFDELVFPITFAPEGQIVGYLSDLPIYNWSGPIPVYSRVKYAYRDNLNNYHEFTYTSTTISKIVVGDNRSIGQRMLMASSEQAVGYSNHKKIVNGVVEVDETTTITGSSEFTYGNKTVYYKAWTNEAFNFQYIDQDPSVSGGPRNPANNVAWTVVYGREANHVAQLPVNWTNKYDGSNTTSSFEISVIVS